MVWHLALSEAQLIKLQLNCLMQFIDVVLANVFPTLFVCYLLARPAPPPGPAGQFSRGNINRKV